MKKDLQYLKVFTGSSHPALGKEICKKIGITPGKINIENFSCGEKYVQIGESVRGCNCFVIQTATGNVDKELIELFLIIDALKRSLARYIHVVIPHFGYARQDKITDPREPISAKLMAELIERAGGKHTITLDLHSAQTQAFFEKPVDNLTAKKLFLDYFAKKKLKNAVVVSPDAGGAKNAEKFAKLLGTDLAILHKSRPKHNVAQIQAVIGDVKGKAAILFDDIVDTAGSVSAAAKVLRENGATDIYLAATHAVLSGNAFEKLKEAKFKEIVVTDSIPQDYRKLPNVKVISVAGLLANIIEGIHTGRSVSKFWESVKN
ncbi:MAG: ribose-phosphate pyrophosphokinase [Candidatus Gracilibacteria bacterium]|nr:ribose-phosphate pyrophosphokinase [Candidatus Gracilibacteria bacterium]MDD5179008.1 ribose-phosphate pyrophosphokinase [Candidatus Gracilibacteria bacterium]